MFKRLRERLPKKKSQEELDELYKKMEGAELEKGDFLAMLIAAFINIAIPVLLITGVIYGIVWLIFVA